MVEVIDGGQIIGYLDDGRFIPVLAGGVAESTLLLIVAGIGVAAALAGAGVAAYSAVEAGHAREAAGKYNKEVAENQAQAARDQAKIAANIRETEIRRILASQTSRLGASGVIPSEGSPLLVQMESAQQGALDVARLQYSGEVGARGYESQGILEGFYGKQARRAGNLGAGSSLLSGVGSAASIGATGYGQYRAAQA